MMLDAREIAAMTHLNPEHVRDRLVRRPGFPPAYRLGGVLRWKREDVEEWIEAQRVSPASRRSARRTR